MSGASDVLLSPEADVLFGSSAHISSGSEGEVLGVLEGRSRSSPGVEGRYGPGANLAWLGMRRSGRVRSSVLGWQTSTTMDFPTGPDPFGLLHHHRCEPPRTRAIQVVLADCMTELVTEQIALVIDQVRSIRVHVKQPSSGVQHHSVAVLAGHFATDEVSHTNRWLPQPRRGLIANAGVSTMRRCGPDSSAEGANRAKPPLRLSPTQMESAPHH